MDLGVRLRLLAIRASLFAFPEAVDRPFGRTLRRFVRTYGVQFSAERVIRPSASVTRLDDPKGYAQSG
jgi:hypothetical protein